MQKDLPKDYRLPLGMIIFPLLIFFFSCSPSSKKTETDILPDINNANNQINRMAIQGCADLQATNYEEKANRNDDSCQYPPNTVAVTQSTDLPKTMEETSGLLFLKDKLLTFNDEQDTRLYLLNPSDPEEYEVLSIPNVKNVDWEEIQDDADYLYIGDIGNNNWGNRKDLRFYRLKKEQLRNNPQIDTISFTYENQTDFALQKLNQTDFDCESFIVTTDKIYLFTKQWKSNKTALYELDKSPGHHTAILKGEWNVEGLITGAFNLDEKNVIVLCGYSPLLMPFVYLLYDYPGKDFFAGNKRKIMLDLPLHQVEGIASKDGLIFYISNERFERGRGVLQVGTAQQLHRLDLSPYLQDFLSN